jgi:ABC-type uncharacterized transport system auxiliary subunit
LVAENVIVGMMTSRVLVAALAVATLAGCAGSAKSEAQATPTTARQAVVPVSTTTTTSKVHATLDGYNPNHDAGTCVRLLPNGEVQYVKILLVPGQSKPAYVNGAKCG